MVYMDTNPKSIFTCVFITKYFSCLYSRMRRRNAHRRRAVRVRSAAAAAKPRSAGRDAV